MTEVKDEVAIVEAIGVDVSLPYMLRHVLRLVELKHRDFVAQLQVQLAQRGSA